MHTYKHKHTHTYTYMYVLTCKPLSALRPCFLVKLKWGTNWGHSILRSDDRNLCIRLFFWELIFCNFIFPVKSKSRDYISWKSIYMSCIAKKFSSVLLYLVVMEIPNLSCRRKQRRWLLLVVVILAWKLLRQQLVGNLIQRYISPFEAAMITWYVSGQILHICINNGLFEYTFLHVKFSFTLQNRLYSQRITCCKDCLLLHLLRDMNNYTNRMVSNL